MQNIVFHDNFLICNTYLNLNLYDHLYHVIGLVIQSSSDYLSGCKALNLFIIFSLKAYACERGLAYPPASFVG